MKKQFSAIILSLGLFFSGAANVFAGQLCPPGQFSTLCDLGLQEGQENNIVGTIITVLIVLAVILCLIFLIWGGIRWITSGGDKGKIDQARGTITAAIVGLLIALLAFAIVNIVAYFFTGQSFSNFEIPRL